MQLYFPTLLANNFQLRILVNRQIFYSYRVKKVTNYLFPLQLNECHGI